VVRLFAMTCGWIEAEYRAFLEDEPGRLRVPVPCYLIDHPRGKVVFDSGLHVDIQTDAAARLGVLARFFDVTFHPGEDIAARLAALDVDATKIRHLVTSHLHFDHAGGNAALPNARIVIQHREWEAGRDADRITASGYNPADYDTGQEVLTIDGEHDLLGDGSVTCLPTYGHTPGHQSLRVRLPDGDVVLTSDACYLRRTLEELRLSPVVYNRDAMLASLRRLRTLRDAGARLFYGHDPEFWATVPQAPAEVRAAAIP